MATLLEKARTLASASLSVMLDRALRAQSLVVLDEYIRHVQDSLDDLNDAAVTIGGQVKALRQKASEYDRQAQDLDQDVDSLLLRGNDDLAVSAQRKLNNAQDMAREYRSHHARQQREYQQILDARLTLEAKLTAIRQEREEVQALLESASSAPDCAHALSTKGDPSPVQGPGATRIASSIRSRLDDSNAGDGSRAELVNRQIDRLLSTQKIETQLLQRKHRLGISPGTSQAEG